jgi:hypothetical protein
MIDPLPLVGLKIPNLIETLIANIAKVSTPEVADCELSNLLHL